MFSSTSSAEWTEVGWKDETTYYVDFERIRKHDGYVYYWNLADELKPTKFGNLSSKSYEQVDCKMLRYKVLSDSYYTEPMGRGIRSASSNEPDKEWNYPSPNSVDEELLKTVCSR